MVGPGNHLAKGKAKHMAASELADAIGASSWWANYQDRAVVFFVILDADGNAIDYEYSTNVAVSEADDPAAVLAQAKKALKTIEF